MYYIASYMICCSLLNILRKASPSLPKTDWFFFFASDMINYGDNQDSYWNTPTVEDPLKLPESNQDDGNILSSFLNNNDQAKAFGISSTENEFISLDSLNDRNRSALVSICLEIKFTIAVRIIKNLIKLGCKCPSV